MRLCCLGNCFTWDRKIPSACLRTLSIFGFGILVLAMMLWLVQTKLKDQLLLQHIFLLIWSWGASWLILTMKKTTSETILPADVCSFPFIQQFTTNPYLDTILPFRRERASQCRVSLRMGSRKEAAVFLAFSWQAQSNKTSGQNPSFPLLKNFPSPSRWDSWPTAAGIPNAIARQASDKHLRKHM